MTAQDRSRGFALIIVLWTLVLIALITTYLVANGRVEIRIAENLVANAVGASAADGAIYDTAFKLMNPNPQNRWPLDGTSHALAIGGCHAFVTVGDENARVNPNLASPALIQALLQVTGTDAELAQLIARHIGEWIGAAGAARTHDALDAEYRAAGRAYRPPGEPVETLDELRGVLGMTPGVFDAIRPHLSRFAAAEPSGSGDPVVAAALAQLGRPPAAVRNPAASAGEVLTMRVSAHAKCARNALAERTVVIRVTTRPPAYTILSWDPGD